MPVGLPIGLFEHTRADVNGHFVLPNPLFETVALFKFTRFEKAPNEDKALRSTAGPFTSDNSIFKQSIGNFKFQVSSSHSNERIKGAVKSAGISRTLNCLGRYFAISDNSFCTLLDVKNSSHTIRYSVHIGFVQYPVVYMK